MNAILWIGFGLLALLVVFLIVAFFLTPKLTDDQRRNMKFLTALCAAASGGFLTGGAIFTMETTGATKFGISATGGIALFCIVWFFYPKAFSLPNGGIQFSIKDGWTFKFAVDTITKGYDAFSQYKGFTEQELNAPLESRAFSAKSLEEAFQNLRFASKTKDAIRPYDVEKQGSIYTLTIQ